MTNFQGPEYALNAIQPISDDFSTDGYLPEFARVDHQHPLSPTLRAAIFGTGGVSPYVKKTGDTMTGALNMLGADINLTTSGIVASLNLNTTNNRICYHSSPSGLPWMVGPRIIGETGVSFYNVAQGADVWGYRGVAGTYYMWVTNKLLVGSSPSDALAIQALTVNGHIAFNGGYSLIWYQGGPGTQLGSVWMQDPTWVRASPNIYCGASIAAGQYIIAGGSTSHGTALSVWGNARATGNITADSTMNALQYWGTQRSPENWTGMSFVSSPGAGWAGHAFHCGGVAPIIFSANGNGELIFFRNTNGGLGCALSASSYNLDSSRKIKRNINPWPMKAGGAAVECASDVLARLIPSTFQLIADWPEIPSGRRLEAYHRLNSFYQNRNLPVYKLPNHDCAEHDCKGTSDDPCIRTIHAERMRYGFIAEDVFEVVPEAVLLDIDKQPMSIDYAMLTTISIAAIQELTERISLLEGVS